MSLEWIAAPLGIISVALTVRRHIWCWPIGAVMVALYLVVFWQAKLYADAALQGVYFVLQLYGWWEWRKSAPVGSYAPVRILSVRHRALGFVACFVLTLILGTVLGRYTDQAYPLTDSGIAVFSLLAQWLMAARYFENWPVWVAVDVVAVVVYCLKGLYATAGLYAVFIALAVAGWYEWRKVAGGTE